MSHGLMNWTFDDVVNVLKKHGFKYSHAKGSHHFYLGFANGASRQVVVQFHGKRALKPRTLKGIILQSGIPKDEWLGS